MAARVDELLRIAAETSREERPAFQDNECFTAGAFDLRLVKAQGGVAFELLQAICDEFDWVNSRGAPLEGYFELLAQLARQGDTTEMPRGLAAIMAKHPEHAGELRDWYRRAG